VVSPLVGYHTETWKVPACVIGGFQLTIEPYASCGLYRLGDPLYPASPLASQMPDSE
jgi:hypothetical protein